MRSLAFLGRCTEWEHELRAYATALGIIVLAGTWTAALADDANSRSKPRVRVTGVRVDGERAGRAMAQRIRNKTRALRPVAARLATSRGALRGALHVELEVAPSGRVSRARITRDTVGVAPLASATLKLYRRTRLPARDTETSRTVTFAVRFR